MKRVLLVTQIFPPMIGGPATFIDRAAHAFARAGVKVTVVCATMGGREKSDADRPFRVVRIPMSNRLRYEAVFRMVLTFQMARHRMILVNGAEPQAFDASRVTGRGYILKIVGDSVWEMARNQGRTCLDIDAFQTDPASRETWRAQTARRNRYVLRASQIVVPSEYLRGLVAQWGVPKERISVIFNGVDMDGHGARPRDQRRRQPGEPLRVLFVGRLTNWKGVDTLILAAHQCPFLSVTVVGDGPSLPSLVALRDQLGLGSRVEFRGKLGPQEVLARMEQDHVLVLTSLYEGLSHTLLEAISRGMPCVASHCGGNDEVIRDGDNGLLVKPLDVKALGSALQRLHEDEEFRLKLAQGARQRAPEFSLDKTIDGYRRELAL